MSRTGLAMAFSALVSAAGSLPATSAAQTTLPGPSSVDAAAQLFNDGVVAAAQNDFATALRAFVASYELNPLPDVLYNIGMCHKALGDFPASANAFREYVAAVGALAPEEQTEFDALLVELTPRISRIVVEVSEAGATVEVDGVRVGTSPLAGWYAVEPGSHEVIVRKDGFEASRATVEVAAGDTVSTHAALIAVAGPTPETPQPVGGGEEESEGLSPWFWASVGVTGAAVVTMAVTGGLTLKYNDDFNAGGHRDVDLRNTTLALRTTTDVFLGLAIAGAVAGTVLLFVGGADEEAGGETSALSVGLLPSGLVVVW